jgi:hypothetical protein
MRLLTISLTIAVMLFCDSASGGQIWTDRDGDGLPDGGLASAAQPSTNATVGVWIDAQSFSWTGFLAVVEWSGDCISYVSASWVITGGGYRRIRSDYAPNTLAFEGAGFSVTSVTSLCTLIRL